MNEREERTDDYNFCVSNPEALDLYANRTAELALSLYGSNNNFYFWLDDGKNLQCHCQKCKKLSPSDQQTIVLNRTLHAIKKSLPNARVAYLAYYDTVVPPTQTVPADGVFLEYAPFMKYTAKGENAAELIEREKQMLTPLIQLFDKEQKKILEYWYDNSLFSGWKKPPARFVLDEKSMKADIAEYRKAGFDFISTFACFLGEDYENLYGSVDIKPFAEYTK